MLTASEIGTAYLNKLYSFYLFDLGIFSTPRLYYWVFPAIAYFFFFLFKWTLLTFPVWMPIYMIIDGVKKLVIEAIDEISKRLEEKKEKRNAQRETGD